MVTLGVCLTVSDDCGAAFAPGAGESLLRAGIMIFSPGANCGVRIAEAGLGRDPEHARQEKRVAVRYLSLPQQAGLPERGWRGDSLEPAPDRAGINRRSAAGRRPGNNEVRIGGAGPPGATPAEVPVDGGRGECL